MHAYVDEMIRFYKGEEPLIESVRTYDLGRDGVLAEVLERIDELVVKPRAGHGGIGVVVCPHASVEDRDAARREVAARPEGFVVQELVRISTHPTACDGRLAGRQQLPGRRGQGHLAAALS